MIILRYLVRELVGTWLAISGALLLVIAGGRFVKYLQQASVGRLQADVLWAIIGYRLPGFLEISLPLALFLAIILGYGRMYADSEMIVLEACGMSRLRLLLYTSVPAVMAALLVAAISLHVAPWGLRQVEHILQIQAGKPGFEVLMPGRFQTLDQGKRTVYVQKAEEETGYLQRVFIAELLGAAGGDKKRSHFSLVFAQQGHIEQKSVDGPRYMVLESGGRSEVAAGLSAGRLASFDSYGIRLPDPPTLRPATKEKGLPLEQIWGRPEPGRQAEWQWRLSAPLSIPVIVLLAVSLARVNPRQGRFANVLFGLLVYLVYLASLMAARETIASGTLSPVPGLWAVHGLFALLTLVIFFWQQLCDRLSSLRRAWLGRYKPLTGDRPGV